MQLAFADLSCPTCRSYVHPFLERCPGCGSERSSRFGDALADRPADPSLAEDEALLRSAADSAMTYSLIRHRSGGLAGARLATGGGDDGAGPDPVEVADHVASAVGYRAVGLLPAAGEAAEVTVRVRADGIRIAGRGQERSVEPAMLLAATPAAKGVRSLTGWSGLAFAGATELRSPLVDGDGLLLTWRGSSSYCQLTVGNRRGLLTSKARAGHFDELARWLGAVAALAAERRWRETGADSYAVELGLKSAVSRGPSAVGAPAPGGGRPTRARLEELEALREAGLVGEAEYERKRREILDQL